MSWSENHLSKLSTLPAFNVKLFDQLQLVPLTEHSYARTLHHATPLLAYRLQMLAGNSQGNEWVNLLARTPSVPSLSTVLASARSFDIENNITYHCLDAETFLATCMVYLALEQDNVALYLTCNLHWEHDGSIAWRLYELSLESPTHPLGLLTVSEFEKRALRHHAQLQRGECEHDEYLERPEDFWGSSPSSTSAKSSNGMAGTKNQSASFGNFSDQQATAGGAELSSSGNVVCISKHSIQDHVELSMQSLLHLWRSAGSSSEAFLSLSEKLVTESRGS